MRIIYEDDIYPGTTRKYVGKTIKQILEESPNPIGFIKGFNVRNNNMCISDEIRIDKRRIGAFQSNAFSRN